jgi:hypothetical protein
MIIKDVGRARVTGRIDVAAGPQEHQVGLRLVAILVQPHRPLGQDDGIVAGRSDELASGASHTDAVAGPDRCHEDDLAVDELDAVAFREDAGVPHALVLVGREALSDEGGEHDSDLHSSPRCEGQADGFRPQRANRSWSY